MNTRREFIKLVCIGATATLPGFLTAQSVDLSKSNTTKRLVFVHGRSQQGKDPEKLKTLWTETLKKGVDKYGGSLPNDISISFPFYGDLLDDYANQLQVPLTTDIQTKGSPPNSDFLTFQSNIAEEIRIKAGITEEQVDAEYGPNPKEKGPQNWEWVQALLRAIDKNASGLSQGMLEVFMRDVYLYTKRAGVRDEIDRIVASELTEDPTVVVGHSLGSVVAYNVLRSSRDNLSVSLYMSLGSPLGIRAIRNEFRPLRFPSSADAWFNAYDEKDIVALFPLDSTNFPVNPAIENYSGIKNHTSNNHGIIGYLDNKEVARRIMSALG